MLGTCIYSLKSLKHYLFITPTLFKFNVHWPYNCLAFKYIHLQTLQRIYLVFLWFLSTQQFKTYLLCVHSLSLKCYVPLRIWLSIFQTNRQRLAFQYRLSEPYRDPVITGGFYFAILRPLISERVSELTTSHHDPTTSIIYYQQWKRNTDNTYSLTVLRTLYSCSGWWLLFLWDI